MAKYTTTSLIEVLEKFPEDLPIETELALMWNFPDELRKQYSNEMSAKEYDGYEKLTMKNATVLCIFEGSWENGNVSNVDGKFEEFSGGE